MASARFFVLLDDDNGVTRFDGYFGCVGRRLNVSVGGWMRAHVCLSRDNDKNVERNENAATTTTTIRG